MNEFFPSNVWRYCPWCGAKSFRAGDDNYLQCGICRKKFYINASGAVACIIESPQSEILFTRRAFEPAKGMLDLPGGFVSPDETAEEAVKREIKEELNLDTTSVQYICSSHNRYLYGGVVYFTLDLGFRCIVTDFTGMRVADDVDGYVFLPHHRINLQEICFPSIRNILQLYFASSGGADAK
jgi:8-oxo-dGTP pyrophosphatase MutT (NUDIX family)